MLFWPVQLVARAWRVINDIDTNSFVSVNSLVFFDKTALLFTQNRTIFFCSQQDLESLRSNV